MAAKKSVKIVGNVLVLAERPLPSRLTHENGVARFTPQAEYHAWEFPAGEFGGHVLTYMIRVLDNGWTNVRAVDAFTLQTLKDKFTKPEMAKLRKQYGIEAPVVEKIVKPRTRKVAERKAA